MNRVVRATEDFWAALDLALPAGLEPSWHAFAAHELPLIVSRFADEWESLPQQIPTRADYRILIGTGRTVAFAGRRAARRMCWCAASARRSRDVCAWTKQ